MPVEFCVPLSGLLYTQSQLDDLEDRNELSGVGKNAWMVQHQLDMAGEEEATVQTVEDICDRLSGSASGVLDPENFDALYSVATTFSTAYDAVKKPMLTSIVSGLAAIRQASDSYIKQKEKKTQAIIAADDDGDDESALGGDLAATYRSAIKMYAFLLSTLINQQEKSSKDAPIASVDEDGESVAAPTKGRKKVAAKGKKAASARSADSTFDWTMQREKAVGALVDLLSQRTMYSLWRMASPEEEFGAMMLGVAVTLLEREENAKSAGVKEGAFALLALTLQKFPTLQPRAVQQLVHALQHCEALALPLAEAIAFCVAKPYRLSGLLADTLSEIAEIDGAMLSKDAAGARALSTFVINLSTMCPRALLANLPALETQLEAESYVIRNGCVQAMGALVENMNAMNLNEEDDSTSADKKKNLRKGEEEDEKVEEEQKAAAKAEASASADIIISGPQARSRMLGVLLSRVHDVSSFTRAKTLQQLSGLARARAIVEPASYVATMKAAVDRIMDKTGAVRRAAIQLLTSLMEMNPFSPVLQFELFQLKLQQRMENLQKELSNNKKQPIVKKEDVIAEGDEDEEEPGNEEKMEEDAASIASAPVTEQSVKALLSSSVMNDIMFEKARNEIENLFHAINFIQGLTGVIPVLCEMFQSKTATDAAEAVSFFVVAKEFNLSAPVLVASDENVAAAPAALTVEGACKKMAGLIWSREQGTRESVLAAWQRLYFHPDLTARDGSPQQKKAALVSIQALLNLVLSSNMSELTSLEEILTKLYYANAIPTIMIDSIWELVVQESTATHAKAGLITLVNYFSNASGFVLSNHVQELLEVGLSGVAISSAPFLVRAAMVSLQKWSAAIKNAPTPSQAPPAISEKTQQAIFQRMEVLFLHTTNSHVSVKQSQAWYSMVEQVLNSLYMLHPTPEKFMENILQQLTPLVFAPSTASNEPQLGNSEKLSRFLFLLAHTAMRTLVHLETLEKEIKALKSKAAAKAAGPQIETERIGLDDVEMKDEDEEEEKSSVASKRGKKAPAKKATKGKKKRKDESESEEEDVEEISEEDFEEEEKKPAKKKAAPKKAAAAPPAAASSIEDDLASAAAAEYELEQRREIAESQLIQSSVSAQGLLSLFAPMVESIVLSLIPGPAYGRFQGHAHLQINAVMALCKFMSINVTYCESNLRLLFSVLTAPSTDATIKGNIIIALGDLFLRFPNSIEPYSEYMYHGLKKQAPVAGKKNAAANAMSEDDEVYVRKNTLMVLTHLILNDMLKAKGPLAEIAKCTQDYSSHPRIAELSKCFFQELNNKTGDSKATIYNILPDIISRLSQDSTVDEEAFQNIFKFLLSFIHKDKQIENLIEKLVNRFEFVYVEPVAPTINVHANAEVHADGNPVEADAMSVATSSSSSSAPLTALELSLKQCRDLSYCLTQLPFSLVSLKKLSQLFRCYQAKLGDRVVFDHFMSITARARKGVAASKEKANPASGESAPAAPAAAKTEKDSPELQALCDELEAKYTGAFEKLQEEAMVTAKAKNARGKKGYGERVAAVEAEEAEEARKREEAAILEAEAAAAAAPIAARGGRKAAAKAPAKKSAKSSRRRKDESSEEEEEEEEESVEEVSEDEEEEEEVKPKKGAAKKPAPKKAAAPAKSGRRKKVVDSDDE